MCTSVPFPSIVLTEGGQKYGVSGCVFVCGCVCVCACVCGMCVSAHPGICLD